MREVIRRLLDHAAKMSIARRSDLRVAPDTQVSFRGIKARPPSRLTIGSGTIFQGRIVADRPQAEVSIGERTFVGTSTLICAERIEIGNDVLVSWGCTIVDHDSHPVAWEDRKNDVADTFRGQKDWSRVTVAPVIIEDQAWVGFNVIILRGVRIGKGSIVGAGSVVTKNVPPGHVVGGAPARILRTLSGG